MWFDDHGNPQYKLHADPDSPSSRFRQHEELRRLEQEASQLTIGAGRRQGQQHAQRFDAAASGWHDGTPSGSRRREGPLPRERAAPPPQYLDDDEPLRFTPASSSSRQTPSASPPADSALEALYHILPHLSPAFRCSDADAMVLLAAVGNGGGGSGGGAAGVYGGLHVGHLEDRLSIVEAENRALMARLEGRTDECDKLKDDLGEARQKLRAVQQQATQSGQLLSQRREEVRKQLILEEGRTAKLQQQNKVLTQEVEKLKQRLHTAMR